MKILNFMFYNKEIGIGIKFIYQFLITMDKNFKNNG